MFGTRTRRIEELNAEVEKLSRSIYEKDNKIGELEARLRDTKQFCGIEIKRERDHALKCQNAQRQVIDALQNRLAGAIAYLQGECAALQTDTVDGSLNKHAPGMVLSGSCMDSHPISSSTKASASVGRENVEQTKKDMAQIVTFYRSLWKELYGSSAPRRDILREKSIGLCALLPEPLRKTHARMFHMAKLCPVYPFGSNEFAARPYAVSLAQNLGRMVWVSFIASGGHPRAFPKHVRDLRAGNYFTGRAIPQAGGHSLRYDFTTEKWLTISCKNAAN